MGTEESRDEGSFSLCEHSCLLEWMTKQTRPLEAVAMMAHVILGPVEIKQLLELNRSASSTYNSITDRTSFTISTESPVSKHHVVKYYVWKVYVRPHALSTYVQAVDTLSPKWRRLCYPLKIPPGASWRCSVLYLQSKITLIFQLVTFLNEPPWANAVESTN